VHPALAYLTVQSLRNGIAVRLGRLRRPRYLAAAIGGVAYLALMIMNRWLSGGFSIPEGYEGVARAVAAVFIAAAMSLTWLLPQSAALRFTLSDVQFLFPAPLPRQEILKYKIVRLLIGAGAMALPLTLIVGPVHIVAALLFYVKLAAIGGVVALHEAGVSLYRINVRASGGLSIRRRVNVFSANAAIVLISVWILTRLAFSSGLDEFLFFGILTVLGGLAQTFWILRSDAAFEEDAATVSEKTHVALARMGRGQLAKPRLRSTSSPLAPHGPIEMAILWKNWLLLSRTSGRQWIAIGSLLGIAVIAARAFVFDEGDPAAGFIGFTIAAITVMAGPAMLRIDLRQDLGNLALLRTWPVPGAAIVRGELLAPTIVLTVAAVSGASVGVFFAPDSMLPAAGGAIGRLGSFFMIAFALTAVIVAQLVVQNGIAALFPAWVRIDPGMVQPGGLEMMGHGMVATYGGLVVVLLLAVVPALAALALRFIGGGTLAPIGLFAGLLLLESLAATEIIGRIVDRTDLQDVAIRE
jgi:hypothetical protein